MLQEEEWPAKERETSSACSNYTHADWLFIYLQYLFGTNKRLPKTAGSVVIIPQPCVKHRKLTIKKQQFLNDGSTVCVSGYEFRLCRGKAEE